MAFASFTGLRKLGAPWYLALPITSATRFCESELLVTAIKVRCPPQAVIDHKKQNDRNAIVPNFLIPHRNASS
jgi:hypothetical protein